MQLSLELIILLLLPTLLLPVLVAGPGLDVESAALFTAKADEAAAAEAAAAAAVEVAPEVDP